MNLDLAQMYNTPGAEKLTEDMEKVAQAELFAKLAADEGIDINQLNDEQVEELWNLTFSKEAEGETCPECKHAKSECTCPKEEKKEETKESAAQTEFESIKTAEQEWNEKVAEFDFLGRLMAHAYVQELGEIGSGLDKEAGDKEAGVKELFGAAKGKAQSAFQAAKGKAQAAGSAVKGKAQAAKGAVEGHLERTGRKMQEAYAARRIRGGVHAKDVKGGADISARRAKLTGAAPYAAGAAALGAGGYAMKKKSSANIDELALELALQKAAEAGYDADECDDRLASVITLGIADESEKMASAGNLDEAVEIRSLEFLSAAGYPVTWAEGE